MLCRLLMDKKRLYLFFSMIILSSSIITFGILKHAYSNDAAIYKEKTVEESMIILSSIGKEMRYNRSFMKTLLK